MGAPRASTAFTTIKNHRLHPCASPRPPPSTRDNEAIKKSLKSYDDALERYPGPMAQPSRDPRSHAPHPPVCRYIPVLMAQAKIYWDLEHYAMVEKVTQCLAHHGPCHPSSTPRPPTADAPYPRPAHPASPHLTPPPPAMVEKIFRQSAEFCSEHDLWKLNVAHVFFLQARARASCPHVTFHIPHPT